jgi:hypothetical protein
MVNSFTVSQHHSEAPGKRGQATAQDEATHTNGRAAPTIDDQTIKMLADQFLVHVEPERTALHDHGWRFFVEIEGNLIHQPQLHKNANVRGGGSGVGVATVLDSDRDLPGFCNLYNVSHVAGTLGLHHAGRA